MTSDDRIADIGRGVAQLHTRLGRVLETLQDLPAGQAQAPAGDDGALEALLDLMEATERALEAPREQPQRRRWFGRREPSSGAGQAGAADRGLRIALDVAGEKLQHMGIEPTPDSGALDPELHRAIEVLPTDDPQLAGQIAETFRRGWRKRTGGGRQVVRTAQVSVYGKQS